jgi:hypothetical protein
MTYERAAAWLPKTLLGRCMTPELSPARLHAAHPCPAAAKVPGPLTARSARFVGGLAPRVRMTESPRTRCMPPQRPARHKRMHRGWRVQGEDRGDLPSSPPPQPREIKGPLHPCAVAGRRGGKPPSRCPSTGREPIQAAGASCSWLPQAAPKAAICAQGKLM